MKKQLLRDTFGWGFLLWLIGFALGMIFFSIVPVSMIGWFILPIGTAITLWVLVKKVAPGRLKRYIIIGVVWTLIAVVCDYFFLVKAFKPADGYYKLDVYIYYALTFLLPVIVGSRRAKDIT